VIWWITTGDVTYSLVIIVNKDVYLEFTENRPQACLTTYTHTHTPPHIHPCEVMDMLINLIVIIISQCRHITKHHTVYLQYIQSHLNLPGKKINTFVLWALSLFFFFFLILASATVWAIFTLKTLFTPPDGTWGLSWAKLLLARTAYGVC
jgi:hypothetical protein